jgi:hypothetical protein
MPSVSSYSPLFWIFPQIYCWIWVTVKFRRTNTET